MGKIYYQGELIQCLSTVAKGRFHPDKRCSPDHKTWTPSRYIQYLLSQCEQIGPAVLEWANLAEAERHKRAYRTIQGVVALTKTYPHVIINFACQKMR
jgi:hypothetical protein